MSKIRYIGPVPREVVVPALNLDGSVKVGDVIEVDAGAAEALCAQDGWERATAKPEAAAKKAPTTKTDAANPAADDNAQEG